MTKLRKSAPVPGAISNAVMILEGQDAKRGIINLRNVGRYSFAVGALDKYGDLIQPHIFMAPGEAVSSYVPPADADKIILVGERQELVAMKQETDMQPQIGVAILEYDLP
jgi:hypothetical protein